jgi:streptogramin lyase
MDCAGLRDAEEERLTARMVVRGLLRQRQRRGVHGAAVAAAGAAVAVLFGVTACASGSDERDSGVAAPVSEDTNAPAPPVVAKFNLPADSEKPIFTADAAWIPTQGGQLTRVDPETNKSDVVQKGDGMGGTSAMSAFGSIWVWHEGQGLFRLDPDTGAVIARIREDVELKAIGFGSLWGMDVGHEVLRIDPQTNQVVARLRVSDEKEETEATGCVEPFRATCPDYLTVHEDKVVVFVDGEDAAVHIDPATNQVTQRVPMPAHTSAFFRLYGDVPWIMTDSGLAQVDLDSGEVLAQIPLEEDQRTLTFPALYPSVAVNGDTAWLVADYTTTEIDLERGEVVETFDTPGFGGVLAASFGHGDLWVSYTGGTVRRLDVSDS